MAARKAIGKSTRWQIFARDGFCCRYCGAQAGEGSTELVIDHVVSVADGGGNEMDNLITACQSCNGGKSSRSIDQIPTAQDVIDRLEAKEARLSVQAELIALCNEHRREIRQGIINMKCAAYDAESIAVAPNEIAAVTRLIETWGVDVVAEWYDIAAANSVPPKNAIRYIRGIARNQGGGDR